MSFEEGDSMDAMVTWNHGLTFSGTADSGFSVALGADPAVGGDNDGLRPMELIALGLAGCTAIDVISILMKKRQEVTGFEVRVHADAAPEHPKVFTDIVIGYIVHGRRIDPAAVERSIELSESRYCPAQGMLARVVPIRHEYRIVEEGPAPPA
jgi:putative redox protein